MQFLREIFDRLLSHKNEIWCEIESQTFTYGDLHQYFVNHQYGIETSEGPIGVIIRNDFETYAALISCWLGGKAYVPLNPHYPEQRLIDIVETADIKYLIDSKNEGLTHIKTLINLRPDHNSVSSTSEISFPEASQWAYILFTSGTTGKPKGVPISFGNLQAFFDGFFQLGYHLTDQDRFLNMFELTFDLSVMSFGVPSILGASFYVPSKKLVKPLALYDTLESKNISFALMVPSAVDLLSPYIDEMELPHLKITQFCGESLKLDQVKLWKKACPSSQIDNVYGPTEATIYCSRYTVPENIESCLHHHGNICIGKAMHHSILWVNEQGELYIGGQQITSGYLNPNEEMMSKFIQVDSQRYYNSGDLGSIAESHFFCHGRSDDQIKIQGYRVELAEIEWVGTQLKPGIQNRCIPISGKNGWELHLIFDAESFDISVHSINEKLPEYMHIRGIHFLHPFPLNANGKVDKKALALQINSLI